VSRNSTWNGFIALAAILLAIANIGLWANRGFADEARFASTATEVMEQAAVRQAIAEAIVREALVDHPMLYRLGGRAAENAVADLLGTPVMQTTQHAIAMHLHRMLVSDERPTFTITSRLLQAIALAVAVVAPLQAATFTFEAGTLHVELFARQDIPSYGTHLDALRVGGVISGLLALGLLAGSVIAGGTRRRAVRRAAFALVATFALTLALIVPLRSVVVAGIEDTSARTIVSEVYGALMWSLVAQAAFLLVAGVLLWIVAGQLPRDDAGTADTASTPA
jgi:hypothetical protein